MRKVTYIVLLFLSSRALGQDTLVYTHTRFRVTETSYFIKSDSNFNEGHFIKLIDVDDGQKLIESGTFKETDKEIILEDFKIIQTQKGGHLNAHGSFIVDSTITDTLNRKLIFKKKGRTLKLKTCFLKEQVKYVRPPEADIRTYLNRLKLAN